MSLLDKHTTISEFLRISQEERDRLEAENKALSEALVICSEKRQALESRIELISREVPKINKFLYPDYQYITDRAQGYEPESVALEKEIKEQIVSQHLTGNITNIKKFTTKNGQQIAIIELGADFGIVVFPRLWSAYRKELETRFQNGDTLIFHCEEIDPVVGTYPMVSFSVLEVS